MIPYQGITTTECLPGEQQHGKKSEIEEAVALCQRGVKEGFSNFLDATSTGRKVHCKYHHSRCVCLQCRRMAPMMFAGMVDFGLDEVACLVKWFGPILKNGGYNVEAVPKQWVSLKMMAKTQFQDMPYSRLWSTMLSKEPYKSDCQDVLHVVELLLILPISSAQCEHAFSTQNRFKNAKHSCLEMETIEDLICMSSEGPPWMCLIHHMQWSCGLLVERSQDGHSSSIIKRAKRLSRNVCVA